MEHQMRIDEQLKDQRDRHADAMERVVQQKEQEMEARLGEQSQFIESQYSLEMREKVEARNRDNHNEKLMLMAQHSSQIDNLRNEVRRGIE